jgi:hypothetical protein
VKLSEHQHAIRVRVIDSIELSAREADFLRKRAKHCIETGMHGHAACSALIRLLDAANVPVRDDEPVYGIFEAPEKTPEWIKP